MSAAEGTHGHGDLAATRSRQSLTRHDPDHRILEAAMAADADYLVTGDRRHLQRLQGFRDTRIVSPREFLDLLNR